MVKPRWFWFNPPSLFVDTDKAGEDAALHCDAFDVLQMSLAVEQLLTDETLRDRLVANGLKNLDRFSWKECAQKTLKKHWMSIARWVESRVGENYKFGLGGTLRGEIV